MNQTFPLAIVELGNGARVSGSCSSPGVVLQDFDLSEPGLDFPNHLLPPGSIRNIAAMEDRFAARRADLLRGGIARLRDVVDHGKGSVRRQCQGNCLTDARTSARDQRDMIAEIDSHRRSIRCPVTLSSAEVLCETE